MINIDAIDNDRMLLEGLVSWIASTADIRLTNAVSSVDEYISLPERSRIVLLDLNLEDFTDPIDNVRRLRELGHEVIVVSVIPDVEYIVAATEAGAVAYVTKNNNIGALADIVRRVFSGEFLMTPEHAFWLSQDRRASRPKLSAREADVLELYASGMTLEAVSRRVGIRAGTTREYLSRIKRKYAEVGRPIRSRVDYAVRLREDQFGRRSLGSKNE